MRRDFASRFNDTEKAAESLATALEAYAYLIISLFRRLREKGVINDEDMGKIFEWAVNPQAEPEELDVFNRAYKLIMDQLDSDDGANSRDEAEKEDET